MAKLTAQEKIQAVKTYLEGKEGLKTVAEGFGVSKAILQTWIRQFQHHGEDSKVRIPNHCITPIGRDST